MYMEQLRTKTPEVHGKKGTKVQSEAEKEDKRKV
jgi:hypothetical protein